MVFPHLGWATRGSSCSAAACLEAAEWLPFPGEKQETHTVWASWMVGLLVHDGMVVCSHVWRQLGTLVLRVQQVEARTACLGVQMLSARRITAICAHLCHAGPPTLKTLAVPPLHPAHASRIWGHAPSSPRRPPETRRHLSRISTQVSGPCFPPFLHTPIGVGVDSLRSFASAGQRCMVAAPDDLRRQRCRPCRHSPAR